MKGIFFIFLSIVEYFFYVICMTSLKFTTLFSGKKYSRLDHRSFKYKYIGDFKNVHFSKIYLSISGS